MEILHPNPQFFIITEKKKKVKYCIQGHRVGSEKIHLNLHLLFTSVPHLMTLEKNKYNVIDHVYWIQYDDLIRLQNADNYPWNMQEVTSIEAIDREVRNIIEPSNHSQRSSEMEKKVRESYATG